MKKAIQNLSESYRLLQEYQSDSSS
jgi:hypothetical protein